MRSNPRPLPLPVRILAVIGPLVGDCLFGYVLFLMAARALGG
jgi:hypothetical protein